MAREKKEWHSNFIEYMNFIIHHPNYQGLPIKMKKDGTWSWIAAASTEIGQARKAWCEQKARELGIPIEAGVYAKVMLAIHPTKWKVCQTCGRSMSLYYHYPSAVFLRAIERTFHVLYSDIDPISAIWDDLLNRGYSKTDIATFFIEKGNLRLDPQNAAKEEIINTLEFICRTQGKKLLSPGAMSNFPDRFDGFHTYNRCCRSSQDKGRSKENLKSYTKDRRAYEYWSDGNIHAANQFMGSSFFSGTSADHIGAVSLGFVHDPRYLQPMDISDNSSKRDRLQLEDIQKLIAIEQRTNISPISWYSAILWKFTKEHYQTKTGFPVEIFRNLFKQNMSNFMYLLWYILKNCKQAGEYFLEETLLKPKYQYFAYSYTFNELGEITSQAPRHFTERSQLEMERFRRVAFESVYDYNDKENRNLKPDLNNAEQQLLNNLCISILNFPITQSQIQLMELVETIQKRMIKEQLISKRR